MSQNIVNHNMASIQIFNPDNDLALAFGGENYTAPPMAECLRYDLQMLPIWYAKDDDMILSLDKINEKWKNEISEIFGINRKLISPHKLFHHESCFSPWGWSADMRKRLIDQGVSAKILPSKEYINELRNLSHRRNTIIIHDEISKIMGRRFCPSPLNLDDFEDVRNFAVLHPNCYIKAPWSSSGKGIFRVLDVDAIDFNRWCRGVLKRQGSILCEQAYHNSLDFAMEFISQNGVVKFVGYSVFKNDNHSSFDYGIVASTAYLETYIMKRMSHPEQLKEVRVAMETVLTNLIGAKYSGCLGIDMMLYKNNEYTELNPCIEMNLRKTMGYVTSIIGDNYLAPGRVGRFGVKYHKSTNELHEYIKSKKERNPAIIKEGKFFGGTHFLTPIYTDSRYCAYLEIMD